MLKAVIFDFDGVLVDSEQLHYQAFDEIFSPLGVRITVREYYDRFVGMTDEELFRLIDKEKNLNFPEQRLRELFREKAVSFKHLASTKAAIIEGVPQFLKTLADNKIPMAICSGALLDEIEMILQGANLRHFFDCIVSAEQVKKGKPDPEGFLLALKLLNKKLRKSLKSPVVSEPVLSGVEGVEPPIEPKDCIVIEDSHWGLEAAQAAGMHPVAVTNTYAADLLNPADKIVEKLGELSLADLQALCH